MFEEAVRAGDDVIVITISSGLSGTCQSALVAAQDYPGRVYVIDSLSATAGEQVLIEQAIRRRGEGWTAAQIFEELDILRKKGRLFVTLETLEYLKRGGRISKTSAAVGDLLNIKPILTLNGEGKLETVGKARGIAMSHKMLNDSIRAAGGIDFRYPVVLTYAGDLADGAVTNYLEDSRDIFGDHMDQLTIGQLGCVIGTHSGPGAIVVSFVPAE